MAAAGPAAPAPTPEAETQAEPAPLKPWGRAALWLLLAAFAALFIWIVLAPAGYHSATAYRVGAYSPFATCSSPTSQAAYCNA